MSEIKNIYTEKEIFGQPNLWRKVYELLRDRKNELNDFLTPVLQTEGLRIILTGAGSSAFIGEAAAGLFQQGVQTHTQAISTTDIVTHPESVFLKDKPTLLVSFARSGNSPESVEACQLAEEYCDELYQLIITCNKDGDLIKEFSESNEDCFSIIMPEDAHDQSLAMTGSFTSMLMTILLLADYQNIEKRESDVAFVEAQANEVFEQKDMLKDLAQKGFERVVFLGSGPLLGVARECHLKLQELTDGQVICKYDSFLGFRHGPRAVVNENTLVVFLLSTDKHANKYEVDLIKNICADDRAIHCLTVGNLSDNICDFRHVTNIDLSGYGVHTLPATLVGQLLGLYASLHLGLNPDKPSVSGAISRVVQGVNIYKRESVAE